MALGGKLTYKEKSLKMEYWSHDGSMQRPFVIGQGWSAQEVCHIAADSRDMKDHWGQSTLMTTPSPEPDSIQTERAGVPLFAYVVHSYCVV